jgi:hypothetical protein
VQAILTTPLHGFLILTNYLLVMGIGLPATIFIGVGFYGAWRKRPKSVLRQNSELLFISLIMPFVAAYMFVTMRTVRPIFSDNLLVLIVPELLLLAALGAGWLYDTLPLSKTLLAPGIIFVLLVVPLLWTVPMVRLFSQTETRVRMQAWIYDHVPQGSRFLLIEPYNVPLDSLIYPYDHIFSVSHFNENNASQYDYLLISNARLNLYERASELVTDSELAPYRSALAKIEARYARVAWIDRPVNYPGYENMLNMAVYWHQPGLQLFCLNTAACEAVIP